MCKFGVCSVDACKTGCSVTSAKEIGNCDDDNKKADAVCKGSCKELARSCGNQLGCGSWTGDVATFCPRTCGKCSRDKPSAGPCLMLNCSPEYELVETHFHHGCGGKCIKKQEHAPEDASTGGCCEAMTPSCLACAQGLTETEYCAKTQASSAAR